MGEHRSNPQALAARSAPAQSLGLVQEVALVGNIVPRRDILLLQPSDYREVDGHVEVFTHQGRVVDGDLVIDDEPSWAPPAEGIKICRAGIDRLEDDDMELEISIVHRQADTRIADSQGRSHGTQVPLLHLARIPIPHIKHLHSQVRSGNGKLMNGAQKT